MTNDDYKHPPELSKEERENRRGPSIVEMMGEGTVILECLFCGKKREYLLTSKEAKGVFNPFCSNGECEDNFAWEL